MKSIVTLSTLVLITAVSSSSLGAQATASADAKELRAYQLTMPALKQALSVMRRVAEGLENDPRTANAAKLEAEIEALAAKDELTAADEQRLEKLQADLEKIEDTADVMSDAQTLSEMASSMQNEPVYVNALRAEGMSARDFAKFWLSFVQTSFAYGFQKSGAIKQLPDQINPDNIKFFQQHEKEIEALMKEAEALGKKPRG